MAEFFHRDRLGTFLNDLKLCGLGAEVGVYRGDFSQKVLSRWLGREWHLVDPWRSSQDFQTLHGAVEWEMTEAFNEAAKIAAMDPRARLHRSTCLEWQDDRQFDVIYLDASHDYRSASADIDHLWPRIKPGGILAGHDYLDDWRWSDDINRGVLFGVKTAVDRFAASKDRVVAWTREEFPSWWIRKPSSPIQPKEVAVVSMSTSDIPWREIIKSNHQKYCDSWGYTYLHGEPEPESRPISWAKLRHVARALQTHRFVLWIDADAIFQRADLSLTRFWDGKSPFHFFKDQINGLNAGVFFATQSDETQRFLAHWDGMTEFNDHPWWENGALLELERQGELIGTVLPHRLANSYPHFPGCWSADDFIAHVTGLLPPVRLAFLRDLAGRAADAFRLETH